MVLLPCLAFCNGSVDLPLVFTLCVRYLTLGITSLVPALMLGFLTFKALLRETNLFFSDCLKYNLNVLYKHNDLFILYLKLLPLCLHYYNVSNSRS